MICGFDLGSRQVKLALMQNNVINKLMSYDTISFYRQYARQKNGELEVDYSALGIPPCESVVTTGYGRLTVKVAGAKAIPELKAHLLGAIFQTGYTDFTLLDLGGQDSKIVKVKNGKMVDFSTNDKCAASSGRYLENMAQVLDISLSELSKYYQNPVALSSTCAVFGESELIGKIVEGHPVANLAAGVNHTIFKRIQPQLTRMGHELIVFTGGVAKNTAVLQIIKAELQAKVVVPKHPKHNGAIGCCISACQTG